jgi:hypothetical protein
MDVQGTAIMKHKVFCLEKLHLEELWARGGAVG